MDNLRMTSESAAAEASTALKVKVESRAGRTMNGFGLVLLAILHDNRD